MDKQIDIKESVNNENIHY